MEKLLEQGKPEGRLGLPPKLWIDTVENVLEANLETTIKTTANLKRWGRDLDDLLNMSMFNSHN